MGIGSWLGNLKETDNLDDHGAGGRILKNWMRRHALGSSGSG